MLMRSLFTVRIVLLWLSTLTVFWPTISQATDQNALNIVVGWAKPPYVFAEEQKGFEIELVASILSQMGYQSKFIHVPFGRTATMLSSPGVDAIMTVNDTLIPDHERLTFPYIHYQNVIVSLKQSNITITQINDVSKYTVAAFQNAHKILGPEFERAVVASPMYLQVADQSRQVQLLLQDKVDLVVMDINIFNYLAAQTYSGDLAALVDFHFLFPKSAYKMAFKNKAMVVQFNSQLNHYLASSSYERLKSQYKLHQ